MQYLQLALFPLLMCLQDQPYYADCRSSCLEQWLAKPTICQLTPLSSPQWLVSVFISNFYFQTEFFQVGCTFFSSLRPLFWVQKLLSESRVCVQTAERSRRSSNTVPTSFFSALCRMTFGKGQALLWRKTCVISTSMPRTRIVVMARS